MAQSKTSLITTAEKYVEKGQFKRAISTYQKLAKQEPENVRTQLKLGELYLRTGAVGNAKSSFLSSATHYEDSGLVLKAIAVYNQLLQVDPGDPEIRFSLASAYKRIGLANDAAFQYGIAIKGFERSKDIARKLETIRTLLELDSQNLTTRLRLAEEFSRNGLIDEASEQFQLACDALIEQGLVEEFAQVAERLLFHKPDAYETAKLLARYYLGKDYPQRALPLLHNCYRKRKTDVEILDLLAHNFQRLGQTHKAVVVLSQLATIYKDSGLQEEHQDVEQRIIGLDPEHPLAKDAQARQVQANSETAESEEPAVPPPTPEIFPKEEEEPLETQAKPTQEFTIEISEVSAVGGHPPANEPITITPPTLPDIPKEASPPALETMKTEVFNVSGDDFHEITIDEPSSLLTEIQAKENQPTEQFTDDKLTTTTEAPPAPFHEEVTIVTEIQVEEHPIPIEFEEETPQRDEGGLKESELGELQEFDFFVEERLFDEAQSILDDLLNKHPQHPEILGRANLLKEKRSQSEG